MPTHLTLDDRTQIQTLLAQRISITRIALALCKSTTTITNEIRHHSVDEQSGCNGRHFNDCIHRKKCFEMHVCPKCTDTKRIRCSLCTECMSHCSKYQKEFCELLKHPPYVCNGCKIRHLCTLEKRKYNAVLADQQYRATLSESRGGLNLSEEERRQINELVSPLVLKGQSIHHICVNHRDEIPCCEKTMYGYVNSGILDAKRMDLPRAVRFKPRKGIKPMLKVDKACRVGRTLEDYHQFKRDHPEMPVVQLDTVEGIKGGAVLLTVHFIKAKLQLAFWRERNSSKSVTDSFEYLYGKLGMDNYKKIFPLLLADNGTEFSNPGAVECTSEGEVRSRMFYCDPRSPEQKGACENNHEFIRRVIPKGVDIGLYDQTAIDIMMNNINSYGRSDLNDRSPYEMFAFLYGEDILELLGVKKIPRDEIVLNPSLLKPYKKTQP